MFSRLFRLAIFSCSLAMTASAHAADTIETQRQQFDDARLKLDKLSARKTVPQSLRKQIDDLKDYPLYPYLQLSLFKRNLEKRSVKDIEGFLNTYKKLPFKHSLRVLALRKKFKRKQWQDVIALYRPGDKTSYQCMQLTALYKSKQKSKALSQVESIWLSGTSLPKQCDFIIKRWQKAGKQTSALTMQRIELTLEKRQGRLAKYLAKSLNAKDKKTYLYWKKLYNKPQMVSNSHYWKKRGHFANVAMKIAIERLTYRDIAKAMTLIGKIKNHIGFTEKVRAQLINNISLRAMLKDKESAETALTHIDWALLNASKQEQILRHLVGDSQWPLIAALYSKHYRQKDAPIEWQYWYASSLENMGNTQRANALYQEIAKKRRYYGFLASDKLGINYSLNHQALNKDQRIIDDLNKNDYLQRAKEFYLLGDDLPARREWYQLVKPLSEEQRIAAAHIAHDWQWHNRAIITLTMTEQRNDLNLRFPMPHKDDFQTQAKKQDMTLSWPLAIARQESAFLKDATSSAGARGLMQLLPGTAKLQAKKDGVLYYSRKQLHEPALNIKLGTAYLSAMLARFDNNLAVAAAAYNAGPHRVKHWVKEELAQDQWVETIPYRETRSYVKNVLAYAVIYQHHLAQQQKLPSSAIDPSRMGLANK